jgi:hypothetical protein
VDGKRKVRVFLTGKNKWFDFDETMAEEKLSKTITAR